MQSSTPWNPSFNQTKIPQILSYFLQKTSSSHIQNAHWSFLRCYNSSPINVLLTITILSMLVVKHIKMELSISTLIMCDSRLYIRTHSWFDCNGYHPNFQAAQKPSAVYAYICKVNPPVSIGTFINPYAKRYFQAGISRSPQKK